MRSPLRHYLAGSLEVGLGDVAILARALQIPPLQPQVRSLAHADDMINLRRDRTLAVRADLADRIDLELMVA